MPDICLLPYITASRNESSESIASRFQPPQARPWRVISPKKACVYARSKLRNPGSKHEQAASHQNVSSSYAAGGALAKEDRIAECLRKSGLRAQTQSNEGPPMQPSANICRGKFCTICQGGMHTLTLIAETIKRQSSALAQR